MTWGKDEENFRGVLRHLARGSERREFVEKLQRVAMTALY